DYLYRLLALEPFKTAVREENAARNLGIFSQLLNVFQSYYHYTVVTHRNREFLRLHLFNSFLRLLYDGGINEYEDPDRPFPKGHFATIWQGLPQWPYVQKDLLASQRFALRDRMPVKKTYSFTGDLKIYETCPRQYQFFREYDFTPSRSAVIFFGLLVHQTIEEMHRIVLDGKLGTLDESRIRELFDRTFRFLCLSDVRPIGAAAREAAFRQVMNYFLQNQDEMKRVIETEVDVSLEKDGYILVGKVDLLLGR